MKNNYNCNLSDLLRIFEDKVSASDILSSKALAEISSTIAKYRIEKGMNQKQFAEYMGVSQGMVSKWESQDYNFTIKTLADIAAKLDLDLNIRLQKARNIYDTDTEKTFHITISTKKQFFITSKDSSFISSPIYTKKHTDGTDDKLERQEGLKWFSL